MKEPIKLFYEKIGFDNRIVKRIVCGQKYVAVLLKNGNIGVCATLNNYVNIDIHDLRTPDIKNIQHRIILNAYYNATLNYNNQYDNTIDIFDKINFKRYHKVVMVGFFRSLIKKFEKDNINLLVFDKAVEDSKLTDMSKQIKEVSKADALILSSTSIFNETFTELTNTTNQCDVYALGPSTILHKDMFRYKNIKLLFGATFKPNDINVLSVIENGGGTKQYLPFMNKVFFNP